MAGACVNNQDGFVDYVEFWAVIVNRENRIRKFVFTDAAIQLASGQLVRGKFRRGGIVRSDDGSPHLPAASEIAARMAFDVKPKRSVPGRETISATIIARGHDRSGNEYELTKTFQPTHDVFNPPEVSVFGSSKSGGDVTIVNCNFENVDSLFSGAKIGGDLGLIDSNVMLNSASIVKPLGDAKPDKNTG